LLKRLEKYPVFDDGTVENIIDKSRDYARLVIHRLKKADLINAIEKGKYTIYNDAFLIASRIVWPSYISNWAALQYYNLTEQFPNTIDVITTRVRKQRILKFKGSGIRFVRFKINNFFGFKKIYYSNFEVFIAEKEKALLDLLFLRKISLEDFSKIIKTKRNKINKDKIKIYAKKMGKFLYKRLKDVV